MKKLLHLDGDASGNTSLCCWPKRHGGREAQRTTLVVVRTGTRDPLARHGIDSRTITGAGTGSFEFEAASGIYTEPQCGSYIFMGAGYGKNRDRDGEPTDERASDEHGSPPCQPPPAGSGSAARSPAIATRPSTPSLCPTSGRVRGALYVCVRGNCVEQV